MADDDNLLEMADALMHRHRVFVAGTAAPAADRVEHDDVPVLTEVVKSEDVPMAAPPLRPVDLAELRNAIAVEVEAWLDEELPRHIMHVLDGLTDQLIAHLSLQARTHLLPKLQNLPVLAESPVTPAGNDNSGPDAPV